MFTIIVLYPPEFRCYEKFERKILNIVKNIQDFKFLCPSDHNQLLQKLIKQRLPHVEFAIEKYNSINDFTHAIIFDDGEVFPDEVKLFEKHGIPLRVIHILVTRVVNIKNDNSFKNIKSTPEYEYIGRGSYWGNPYSMYEDGSDREEVIRKYRYDFENDLFPKKSKSEVIKLAGKRLGCFCKPKACHGDILADYLNSLDDGK
jgi:hypothetical protein